MKSIVPEVDTNLNDKPTREMSGSLVKSAISVVLYAVPIELVLVSVLPWHFIVAAILFTRLYKGSIP